MIKAAVDLGFNESEAELLVNQTFMGSVAIQNSYSLSNEEWDCQSRFKRRDNRKRLESL